MVCISLLLLDGKVLGSFTGIVEADTFAAKHPGSWITVTGIENWEERPLLEKKKRASSVPLLPHSSEVPPKLVLDPVPLSEFVPKTMYYSWSYVPYVLLPVRITHDSSLVYPVWCLIDTGSLITSLENDTRETLGLKKKSGEFLLHHSKNINLLGRRELWRGRLILTTLRTDCSLAMFLQIVL
jgi:hypothetical protein